MQLLTDEIKKALPPLYFTEQTPCLDKMVLVRFFNPMGSQSWEICEGEEEEDGDWRLFGWCDLGLGMPELGYVYLSSLEELNVGLGLGIERDICVGDTSLHPEWANM